MSKMSKNRAYKKARELWGKNAAIQQRKKGGPILLTHAIGQIVMGMFFEVKGQGKSWEEAFADYERKEADWKAKYGGKQNGAAG